MLYNSNKIASILRLAYQPSGVLIAAHVEGATLYARAFYDRPDAVSQTGDQLEKDLIHPPGQQKSGKWGRDDVFEFILNLTSLETPNVSKLALIEFSNTNSLEVFLHDLRKSGWRLIEFPTKQSLELNYLYSGKYGAGKMTELELQQEQAKDWHDGQVEPDWRGRGASKISVNLNRICKLARTK